MKSSVTLAVSIAALSLAGCNKQAAPPAENATSTATTPANDVMASPVAISPAQAFANAAAASDAFEIATSKLAASNGQSAKIKSFAEHMIKAHTESTAKLKTAAGDAAPAIAPDPTLNAFQQATLTDLQGKSGADFDRAYAQAQADAHQKTLDTLKAYSAGGDIPSLKSLASELVPIVTAHLNTAKGLL